MGQSAFLIHQSELARFPDMSNITAKCEVCQSLLDEEDLFCANCGTEAPKRGDVAAAANDSALMTTHNFECSGCGASMSFDAREGKPKCPFCGSVRLESRKDSKTLAPKRVVPFQLNRDQAVASLRAWLGRGWFRPSDLSESAVITEIMPVYVPYWVFEATTHTFWTADSSQTPPGAKGDWHPLSGEHHGRYEGILVGASGVLAPQETFDIGPFDLSKGLPPEQVNLTDITVERFAVPRKYARPLARQSLEAREAEACQGRYVPGRARNVRANVRIEALSSEPVLLPVWIMAYRYREQTYRFLVNGQTGRATGHAPQSIWKMLLGPAIALVIIAIVFLFGYGL